MILGTEGRSGFAIILAEVPLAEMFGYSNDLRSMTQGKGSFSMEFLKYQKVPSKFQEEIVKKAQTREGDRQGLSPSVRIGPARARPWSCPRGLSEGMSQPIRQWDSTTAWDQ